MSSLYFFFFCKGTTIFYPYNQLWNNHILGHTSYYCCFYTFPDLSWNFASKQKCSRQQGPWQQPQNYWIESQWSSKHVKLVNRREEEEEKQNMSYFSTFLSSWFIFSVSCDIFAFFSVSSLVSSKIFCFSWSLSTTRFCRSWLTAKRKTSERENF